MFSSKDLFFTPAASGAYTVSKSLRFRASASAYLNRTPASATNQTTWTWSGWVKRGTLGGSGGSSPYFFSSSSSTTNATFLALGFNGDYLVTTGYTTEYTRTDAVFRDPCAWYHVVIAFDTTQATASNRIKCYVNGVLQTLSNTTYVAQNFATPVNLNQAHYFGGYNVGAGAVVYFDGYLAEVNFIDGQALTPSSFGAYDTNGVWQPARYTGSYGTNGFYLPFSATPTSSYSASFNGSSQYLTTATNAGLGLGTSDFTVEYWMNSSVTTGSLIPLTSGNGTTTYDSLFGYITSSTMVLYMSSTGSSWDIASGRTIISSLSANTWYNIAITRSGSTFRTFVNGVQVDTFTSSASIYQSANQFTIARAQSAQYFNGSLSNIRVIKGTALYTSNFTPSVVPLTAVTNTQLLTLQNATIIDNSANALTITNTGSVTTSVATPWSNLTAGIDSSGNNNTWMSYNINVTSSGVTYDSMLDSPTNATGDIGNYCTWNPVYKNATVAATDGNLSANSGATSSTHRMIFGTLGFTTASYFEITTSGGSTTMVSIVGAGQATTGTADGVYVGSFSKSFGLGYATNAASWYSTGATNANGAATNLVDGTWGFAVDPANGKAWVRNTSGSWIGGGDPAAGTLPTFTWTSDGLPWFPVMSFYNIATTFVGILNAGQRSYAFTAPSGFSALNTQNLPTPTIANGAQYMAAVAYPGTGGTQTVTTSSTNSGNNPNGTTFQPDFVWIKNRSAAYSHLLYDVIRTAGQNKALMSNTTYGEGGNPASDNSTYGYLNSFNSNGITVVQGSDATSYTNGPTSSYIAWQWKAGGTGVSNTSGSITSTVSANTSAGFSVVTWTATGANANIGHGLGVIPSMIIVKSRNAAYNWPVYHVSTGNTGATYLNLTSAFGADSALWQNTTPTSSIFYTGTNLNVSGSGQTQVAYCFAPVAGYSAFGSYTGNGSTDGPFVYTGFRVRWLLLKRTDTTGYTWCVWDSTRNTYNYLDLVLQPTLSDAESSTASVNQFDFLSNGFKCRQGNYNNVSGGTYIYAAFAENPFKISRAR